MKHRVRKRFSQHFLIDHTVIDRMVSAIHPLTNDHLIEIGPGQGVLTKALLPYCSHYNAIEIDRDLVMELRSHFPNLSLIEGDALTIDFSDFNASRLRIVGNLPYHISTPLLFHCLKFSSLIQDMHFMLQKEVVDRIVATPGQKNYGRLSVMIQQICDTESLFDIAPHAFNPPPKVQSSVVRLIPHTRTPVQNKEFFATLVRTVFSQRRKTLKKSCQGLVDETAFKAAKIDSMRRPETLSIAEFITLSDAASTT